MYILYIYIYIYSLNYSNQRYKHTAMIRMRSLCLAVSQGEGIGKWHVLYEAIKVLKSFRDGLAAQVWCSRLFLGHKAHWKCPLAENGIKPGARSAVSYEANQRKAQHYWHVIIDNCWIIEYLFEYLSYVFVRLHSMQWDSNQDQHLQQACHKWEVLPSCNFSWTGPSPSLIKCIQMRLFHIISHLVHLYYSS